MNFEAYRAHLQRKNDQLRLANSRKSNATTPGVASKAAQKKGLPGMIQDSQDEIMELSQPFKVLFEEAVNKVS